MAQNNLQALRSQNRYDANAPESTRGLCFTPAVDIFETEGELLLYADLPGVNPQDVDLRYERGELTLTAKAPRREPQGQLVMGEFETGDFCRVFRVNETIDPARIEAEFKQGVLLVHLPKQEAAKPKQVRVKAV
jgi:HSP20 family protein